MFVNSVIIVLREVLEAALLVSVLLAISRPLQLRVSWLTTGLLLGLIGAAAYGYSINRISEMFEGVGQEVANALLQFGVFASLVVSVFLVARQRCEPYQGDRLLRTVMVIAIVLAVTREGAEILIYVSGFLQMKDFLSNVGLGSLAGASIGYSVGVLFYYFLLSLEARHTLRISLLLLTLVASGIIRQATGLLIQADWITVQGSLWDSSDLIAEDSLPGQLLYALIGYEATPSAIEVLIYTSGIAVMGLAIFAGARLFPLYREHTQ
jgi:high-affinity iron transporter